MFHMFWKVSTLQIKCNLLCVKKKQKGKLPIFYIILGHLVHYVFQLLYTSSIGLLCEALKQNSFVIDIKYHF